MFGGKGGGASHLALGFSDILYLASFAGLGEVGGRGERVGMLQKRHNLSQPWRRASDCNLLCPHVFICCKYLNIFILTNKREKVKVIGMRRLG